MNIIVFADSTGISKLQLTMSKTSTMLFLRAVFISADPKFVGLPHAKKDAEVVIR